MDESIGTLSSTAGLLLLGAMWNSILGAAAGLGGLLVWKGWSNRDGPTEPPGVDASTPIREWPKGLSSNASLNYQFARNWKPCLIVGLVLMLVGLVGTALDSWDYYSSSPSRDEVNETISSDPNNKLDRAELVCMLDLLDAAGVDITSVSRDELVSKSVAATAKMTGTELDEFYACFDAESLASASDRVSELSDAQLREVYLETVLANPDNPITQATAECVVDLIEERGVLRDLETAAQHVTVGLEAALNEASMKCP